MLPPPANPMAAVSAPALVALVAMLRAKIEGRPMPDPSHEIGCELDEALPRILAWHGIGA